MNLVFIFASTVIFWLMAHVGNQSWPEIEEQGDKRAMDAHVIATAGFIIMTIFGCCLFIAGIFHLQ